MKHQPIAAIKDHPQKQVSTSATHYGFPIRIRAGTARPFRLCTVGPLILGAKEEDGIGGDTLNIMQHLSIDLH